VPSGIFRNAPNPNAAQLFQNFLFSVDAQQIFIDVFAHRSSCCGRFSGCEWEISAGIGETPDE
jgi:hypothetical protein